MSNKNPSLLPRLHTGTRSGTPNPGFSNNFSNATRCPESSADETQCGKFTRLIRWYVIQRFLWPQEMFLNTTRVVPIGDPIPVRLFLAWEGDCDTRTPRVRLIRFTEPCLARRFPWGLASCGVSVFSKSDTPGMFRSCINRSLPNLTRPGLTLC